MHYMHGQWPMLVRVLDDGRVPLATNLVENAIRPFVVGRKELAVRRHGGGRQGQRKPLLTDRDRQGERDRAESLPHAPVRSAAHLHFGG
jgi:hypothetical protein